MLDQLFLTVNGWMTGSIGLALVGSFLWGMVSVLFSLGLFLTIAMIGLLCALLGRMLGDVGPYWTIPVGLLLLWVAFDMLGATSKCSLPGGGLLAKLQIKGAGGALILGLAYGILSGSCTFGFIAPLLAIITVQEKIVTGLLLITLFAAGHCLPIAVAGSSTALIRKVLENSAMQRAGGLFRRGAGVLIGGLGIYFIARPFM